MSSVVGPKLSFNDSNKGRENRHKNKKGKKKKERITTKEEEYHYEEHSTAVHHYEEKTVVNRVRSSVSQATCSVCKQHFSNPIRIKCLHSFCEKCLKSYCNDMLPGETAQCPLCREEFKIPDEGFAGLKRDLFLEHRSHEEITGGLRDSVESRVSIRSMCDVCNAGKKAANYCVTCSKKLCKQCTAVHLKGHEEERGGRRVTHVLTQISNAFSEAQSDRFMCNKHNQNVIRLYCHTCNMVLSCGICFEDNHRDHKWSDLERLVTKWLVILIKYEESIHERLERIIEIIQKLDQLEKFYETLYIRIEREIKKQRDYMLQLIDQHAEKLLREVEVNKGRAEVEIGVRIERCQMTIVAMETFLAYSKEIRTRGSAVDVCINAKELHVRAKNLVVVDDKLEENVSEYDVPTVVFIPVDTVELVNSTPSHNLVGTLTTEERDSVVIPRPPSPRPPSRVDGPRESDHLKPIYHPRVDIDVEREVEVEVEVTVGRGRKDSSSSSDSSDDEKRSEKRDSHSD